MSHRLEGTTTDPMSIWEEVEQPAPKRQDATTSKKQPATPPKPEKKG